MIYEWGEEGSSSEIQYDFMRKDFEQCHIHGVEFVDPCIPYALSN